MAKKPTPQALNKAAPKMYEVLKKVQRILNSDAFDEWQGAAVLTHLRVGTGGYEGEPFGDDVDEIIAEIEGSS